jgi:pimeloyl-ACP methyl ester carboxylesterase
MNLELLTQKPTGKSKGDLLFVHGICVGAWVWEKHFTPFFTQAGYTTHALSLRGHGHSEGKKNLARYTLADYTEDLAKTTGKLQNPILIGHSLGGAVVQNYLRTGGKPRAAALLASVPPWGLALAAARMAVTNPRLFAELSRLQTFGVAATNPNVMREALFAPDLPDATFAEFAPLITDESRLIGAELQGFRPFAPLPWQTLPPMFVLGGRIDKFIPSDEVARTAAYYRTEATLIEGLAHTVMLDTHWQSAAEPLLNWLKNLD